MSAGIKIAGFSKMTLLDYPGLVAAEVFLAGCDMRCPFCHNAELLADARIVPAKEVLDYLENRKGMLDGVVVTGGEPTIQPASGFLRELKAMGYKVKLDTNGLRPSTLVQWLSEGYVDYLAMDIKAPPAKYAAVCGLPEPDLMSIKKSIAIVKASRLPYEFRTTVTPSLLAPDDIGLLCEELVPGAPAYWLQPFRLADAVPDRTLAEPDEKYLKACLAAARKHTPSARVRGEDW